MEIVTENPVSLAWIGDAIYSLKARNHILNKGIQKPAAFERASAKICSARGQAAILNELNQRNFFLEDEEEMLRRGRNANVNTTAKTLTARHICRQQLLNVWSVILAATTMKKG